MFMFVFLKNRHLPPPPPPATARSTPLLPPPSPPMVPCDEPEPTNDSTLFRVSIDLVEYERLMFELGIDSTSRTENYAEKGSTTVRQKSKSSKAPNLPTTRLLAVAAVVGGETIAGGGGGGGVLRAVAVGFDHVFDVSRVSGDEGLDHSELEYDSGVGRTLGENLSGPFKETVAIMDKFMYGS
ncbi:hypothetical protein L2E82_06114 [Cichorium intybus]|uniref:Uncharacterized protein n=1 Tax=Cichorium intybus TaxID=13427 RepID=A0ACB9H927_CICIN|nr:hypothetical protein L2E82_06114 [Cichorium intybus]